MNIAKEFREPMEAFHRRILTERAKKHGWSDERLEEEIRRSVERSERAQEEREEKERRELTAADVVFRQISHVIHAGNVFYDEIPRRNPLKSIDDATWAEVYRRAQQQRRSIAAARVNSVTDFDKKEIIKTLKPTPSRRGIEIYNEMVADGTMSEEHYTRLMDHEHAAQTTRELWVEAAYSAYLGDYVEALRQIQDERTRLADALEKELKGAE